MLMLIEASPAMIEFLIGVRLSNLFQVFQSLSDSSRSTLLGQASILYYTKCSVHTYAISSVHV